jgi:PIN domain nuclease of toxin-antitoxin system
VNRYLWDTHALIFAMDGDAELPDASRAAANRVSCVSLLEVAMLVFKGRVKLKLPVEEWLEQVSRRLTIIPITPQIAAKAYNLGEFHGDPADRIIAATSIVYPATVVTRDEKISKHPAVVSLWA